MEEDPSARIITALARAIRQPEETLTSEGVIVEVEPGYEGLANATKLQVSLWWNSRLVELPPEIGMLHRLVELDLRCCKNLRRLPPQIGRLTNLEVLNLHRCEILTELPDEIVQLTSLKELQMDYCVNLERLPRNLHRLSHLEVLNLSDCECLEGLPSDIFHSRSLKRMQLCRCESLTRLPPGIGQLLQLEDLDLSWCNSLAEIPVEIGRLPNLKTLSLCGLSYCLREFLQNIGTSSLSNVTKLELCFCLLEELPPAVGSLQNLEELDLRHCKQLTQISKEVLSMPSLKNLDLHGCSALTISPNEIGEASYYLTDVCFHTDVFDDEMDCYCNMNNAGRHLLRREIEVPDALWRHVLEGPRSDENFVFWFLTHNPNYVRKQVEKKKNQESSL